jgi:hypothetical protein
MYRINSLMRFIHRPLLQIIIMPQQGLKWGMTLGPSKWSNSSYHQMGNFSRLSNTRASCNLYKWSFRNCSGYSFLELRLLCIWLEPVVEILIYHWAYFLVPSCSLFKSFTSYEYIAWELLHLVKVRWS